MFPENAAKYPHHLPFLSLIPSLPSSLLPPVDYVLVHPDVEDALIVELTAAVREFYGSDPRASDSYGRIVNRGHFSRLIRLLESHGGETVTGGDFDASSLYIAPTILRACSPTAPVMSEEIFGPLLPICVATLGTPHNPIYLLLLSHMFLPFPFFS